MKRRIKILIVSTMETARWGGSENLWCESAKCLCEMDIKTVACVQKWEHFDYRIEDLRNQYNLEIIARKGTSGEIAEQTITRQCPTLVVLSLGNSLEGAIWSSVCRKKNIPYVLIVHYAAEWEFPDDDLFDSLQKSYLEAKHIYFVSCKSRAIVENQIATDLSSNSSIVNCPCRIPFDTELPFPCLEQGLRLACVARLDPKDKGQDLAISVLSQDKWRNRPVTLSFFGQGTCEKVVEQLIGRYNLSSAKIVGFVTDIKEIWGNHHVLLLPSRAEGKPLSLMEAMLCGRVPAVTDVAGNTELVKHMNTGFVASYPTFQCVDAMLEQIWDNRDKLQILGENAKTFARNHLDPNPGRSFAKLLYDHCTDSILTQIKKSKQR